LLYSLALSFFLPAAYIHYAKSYEFGALFEFGKIIKVATDDLGKYITAWLVSLLAAVLVGLVVGIVTGLIGWIPCIGWIIAWLIGALAGVYVFYIYGHLFGQVAAGPNAVLPPSKELM
jgi:VIT1/CCC1 family predicted Fe2+/Mn2+ transporter